MNRTHNISFEFEIDELQTTLLVEATVTLAPPEHSHANDPDNDSECEITSVTLGDDDMVGGGWDIDPDAVKLMRKDYKGVVSYWLLTDLLIEAAWEQAERV